MNILCTKMKSIIGVISLSFVAIMLAVVVAMTNLGTLYFGYAMKLVPIYSVETKEKKVALTFDAAWGSDKTEKIVQILKDNNVGGTFFLVGFWIEKNENMVKLIDEAALSRDEMGQYLIVGAHWVECANNGFYLHNLSDDEVVDVLEISQNESGIDIENRVEKAIDWYKKIKKQ